MSGAEWAAVALFVAVIGGLSLVDGDLAVGLLIIVGVIVVVTTFNATQQPAKVGT